MSIKGKNQDIKKDHSIENMKHIQDGQLQEKHGTNEEEIPEA